MGILSCTGCRDFPKDPTWLEPLIPLEE
jgi:hypothetical protein